VSERTVAVPERIMAISSYPSLDAVNVPGVHSHTPVSSVPSSDVQVDALVSVCPSRLVGFGTCAGSVIEFASDV
jgi:glutamine amidotransferase PdxT